MKLLNINAWGGKKLESLKSLLRSEQYDFITLQEVYSLRDKSKNVAMHGEKVMNLLEVLIESLPHAYYYFSPTISMKKGDKYVDFGNVTLSMYPFASTKTIFYDIPYDSDYKKVEGDSTKEPRNLQLSELLIGDNKLSISNTHGIWQFDKKKSDTERTKAMTRKIIENLSLNIPSILSGDFNLTPDTESIKYIEEYMINQVVKNGINNTRNKLKGVVEVVDYVFTSSKVNVQSFCMLDTEASDHNAFVMDFDLEN